ncbi:type II toxin-antitoxin system VapC family toxin [Gordonia sp. VNQ95]|uniref:type II toxin-antitoxin system VapC family toxin n=1 Tax=Gordonia TaxID=2053 RepID=UPI0032B3CD85
MAHYVDTSALAKLVVAETETVALRRWMAADERVLVSSDLARTELLRAVRRVAPDLVIQTRAVLDAVILMTMGTDVFDAAGLLDPAVMRSLDALHLACALDLGDDLEAIVTYDDRLAAAAHALGVATVTPS